MTAFSADLMTVRYPREEVSNGSRPEDSLEASSMIKLNNGMILYLREINQYLALICLMRDTGKNNSGLLEYNVQALAKFVNQVIVQDQQTASTAIPVSDI